MSFLEEIKKSFARGDSVIKLLYINIAIFLVIAVAAIIGYLMVRPDISDSVVQFLSVPSSFKTLLVRPWSVVTYMFTHKDVLHILVNLLWLYWFGKIFLEYFDQRKLVSVYILGGLAGAAAYILSYNIFPAFADVVDKSVPLLGASAAVMAIVFAISSYVPDYTVLLFLFGRVKIKYIALVIFILTSIVDFSSNSGGKLAHIGGAIMGFVFTLNYRKGRDAGKWVGKIIDSAVTLFKPRKRMKVSYKKAADDYEYNRRKTLHQEEINKILDKISKGGYDSLTREEKDLLFRESQKKTF